MAKLKMTAAVTSQVQLAEGIYDLRLAAGEIAAQAVPGQFVSLYSKDGSRLLPRPISLCGIDKEKGELRLVFFKAMNPTDICLRRNKGIFRTDSRRYY